MNKQYPLSFNRAYGPALGTGMIRRIVEDFQVNEILGFEPAGIGEHVYLFVRKTGANTGWVADQLAAFLGLRHFDIGFAGRKDRHAVTYQWFSCWLPGNKDPDWSGLDIEGVELLTIVRHERKLRRGVHQGNRFTIKVSDLAFCHDCRNSEKSEISTHNISSHNISSHEIALLNRRLQKIKESGFPNYFGSQRFGHGGHNLTQAETLLSCASRLPSMKPGKRGGKQRGMYISAARSYMFNHELSARISAGSWQQTESAWLFGLPPHRDIEVPDPVDFFEWGEGLKSLGVKASQRNLTVVPEQFEWEMSGGDDLDLSFTLPTGAYATSLLQELIDLV